MVGCSCQICGDFFTHYGHDSGNCMSLSYSTASENIRQVECM